MCGPKVMSEEFICNNFCSREKICSEMKSKINPMGFPKLKIMLTPISVGNEQRQYVYH